MITVTIQKVNGFGIMARTMPNDRVEGFTKEIQRDGWKVTDVRASQPVKCPTWEQVTMNGRYSCN